MKKKITVSVFITALFAFSLVASGFNPGTKEKMPENVKAVVEKSCIGCHNSDSKNDKAKEALDFKKLDGLSVIKKIGAYKKIGDILQEGKMPPEKFVQRFPEKQISDDEKKLLIDWSKKEAEALVKGK